MITIDNPAVEKKYNRLYPYRGYEETYIEELDKSLSGIEELEDSEKFEVLEFENELFDTEIDGKKILNLEEAYALSVNTFQIYQNAFLSNKNEDGEELSPGINFLIKNLDNLKLTGTTIPEFRNLDDIQEFFYTKLDFQNIETKVLKELSAVGNNFMEEQIAQILVKAYKAKDEELRSEILKEADQFRRITLIANPDVFANKIKGYRDLKKFYKSKKRELKSTDLNSRVTKAKILMVDLHLQRVNQLIADNYTEKINLKRQIDRQEFYKTNNPHIGYRILERERIVNLRRRDNTENLEDLEDEIQIQRNTARSQKFMYGAGEIQKGNYTSTSVELNKRAKTITESTPVNMEVESSAQSTEEQADNVEMPPKVWDVTEAVKNFEKVLQSLDLLSEQQDYEFGRGKPAYDKKWQVVIDPSKKVLSVDTKTKAIKVPEKRAKALTKDIIAHETDHALQVENKKRLEVDLGDDTSMRLRILDTVGLARYSLNAEAGGKGAESEDEPKTPKFTYLRAIQRRELGGSFAECAMDFLKEFRKDQPFTTDEELLVNAKKAFSSAKRINSAVLEDFSDRSGIVLRSRDLVYSEQKIYTEILKNNKYSEFKDILKIGGVNLFNFSQLKRLGLINTGNLLEIPEKYGSLQEYVNGVLSEEG